MPGPPKERNPRMHVRYVRIVLPNHMPTIAANQLPRADILGGTTPTDSRRGMLAPEIRGSALGLPLQEGLDDGRFRLVPQDRLGTRARRGLKP